MTRGWQTYEFRDDAGDDYYIKLFNIIAPEYSKSDRWPVYGRVDISEKYDVVRVYVDGELVGIEMEDRFPSEQLIAKVRLMLL